MADLSVANQLAIMPQQNECYLSWITAEILVILRQPLMQAFKRDVIVSRRTGAEFRCLLSVNGGVVAGMSDGCLVFVNSQGSIYRLNLGIPGSHDEEKRRA